MKVGLATSVVLHGALLAFGLLTLSAPPPMDAGQEALPISIVPLSDLTQIQQGDENAPLAEKAAPTPTERPDIVADAQNTGDNDLDTDNPVTPAEKPLPVKTAEEIKPSSKSVEKPMPEDKPKPKEDPKSVPATEVAPIPVPKEKVMPEPVKEPAPQPKPEPVKQPEPKPAEQPQEKVAEAEPVKPDAVAEAISQEPAKPDEKSAEMPVEKSVLLPSSAPAPQVRPSPTEAQTPKSADRKLAEKPTQVAASKPQSDETGSIEDQVKDALNKIKAKGGGAKRSTQTAAMGGKKTTGGEKLSQGEMDALRGQLGQCWSVPPGMENGSGLRVSVRFKVDASGKVDGQPTVDTSSGNTSFDESAMRAIRKCDRQGLNLPADKAEIWSEVVVNFDPSEMF